MAFELFASRFDVFGFRDVQVLLYLLSTISYRVAMNISKFWELMRRDWRDTGWLGV